MHTSRIRSRLHRARFRLTAILVGTTFVTPAAIAQDMVGPNWLKMLLAFPMLVLYAIGEFALFLVPFFLVMAAITAVLRRSGLQLAKHVPGAGTFVALAMIAGVPAFVYWTRVGNSTQDRAQPTIVKGRKDPKVAALEPPVGKSWPEATGYLDLPQQAQDGLGVIRVSGNLHDTYLKLCHAGQRPCAGLRHAYLRKREEFSFRGLPAGEYELRYLFISRPIVGGRSRSIRISEYVEDDHKVRIDDSPVLDSPRNPIIGIYREDF